MIARAPLPALVLCLACAAAAAQSWTAAGGEEDLWLVRLNADTFDAAVRPVGGTWSSVANDVTGKPAAVAVLGGRLAVLFDDGQYRVFSTLRGLSEPGQTLPGKPLAAWGGTAGDGQPYLLVVALAAEPTPALAPTAAGAAAAPAPPRSPFLPPLGTRPAVAPAAPTSSTQAASSATTSTPAATATASSAPASPAPTLFVSHDSGWRRLAPLPDATLGERGRILPAGLGGEPYVLLARAPAHENLLLHWDGARWQPVPLSDDLAAPAVRGMVAMEGRLVLLLEQPQGAKVALAIATLTGMEGHYERQEITHNGRPMEWDADDLPAAAQLGDQIALVWGREPSLLLATASARTGQLAAKPQKLWALWTWQGQAAQKVMNSFLITVLVATLLLMATTRPPSPIKPFALPGHVRAGSLPRRVLAAGIDFLPFVVLAQLIFQPAAPQAAGSIWHVLEAYAQGLTLGAAYAVVFMFGAYVAYGALAEHFGGATVGKRVMGLRVVGDEAVAPTLRQTALRNLMKIPQMLLILVALLVLMLLLTRYRQHLGDWFARTAVVDARTLRPPTPQPSEPAPPPGESPPR